MREAVDEAERTRPDVVVMDVRLADGSGIEATREIRANHPDTRVLMLTSFADDEALFASIMAGASGYVLKQVKSGDLMRAIRAVGAGDSLLDPSVTNAVLDRLRKGKHLMRDEKLARLSPQEERILTAGRRRADEPRDRRRAPPRGEDREELRLVDPVEARGRAARRGGRLPGPPHHHARLGRVGPSGDQRRDRRLRRRASGASTIRRMPPARKYSSSAARVDPDRHGERRSTCRLRAIASTRAPADPG